jgi:hypothetical protein
MGFIHVAATYRLKAEVEAQEAAAKQAKATVQPPAEETPADLDTAVDALDAELRKYDKLKTKQAELPATIAGLEKKRDALTSQELDSVEAIQSRSAQMSNVSATLELATLRQKRLKTDIAAQEKVLIDIGTKANNLAQQFWSSLQREAFDQARTEFDRLFYHAYEHMDTLEKYKPLALLQWLKIPDLFTSSVDTKLSGCANYVKESIS